MTQLGYHASHEQFAPSNLLGYVRDAEAAGFDCAKSSDHFHPWSEKQASILSSDEEVQRGRAANQIDPLSA